MKGRTFRGTKVTIVPNVEKLVHFLIHTLSLLLLINERSTIEKKSPLNYLRECMILLTWNLIINIGLLIIIIIHHHHHHRQHQTLNLNIELIHFQSI